MAPRQTKKHIFVTGFPTYTTIKIIQKIAEEQSFVHVHMLAMKKFLPMTKKYLNKLSKPAQKKITIYSGDVTYLDLGLSGDEHTYLCNKVTHILHLAAAWDMGVPKDYCEEIDVHGTRNVLDFAEDCKKLVRFGHFSTIHVSGDRNGIIQEDEFDLGQKFKNHQEETRYKSERLVRRHMDKGLPVTIFRLGNVVGDSSNGEILKFEGPYIFAKLLLTTDKTLPFFLPGPCEGLANLVPVDFVAAACIYIFNQEESKGKTYHITDPYPLATRTIFDAVCNYIGRTTPTYGVPKKLYKAVFLIPGMEAFAGVPKHLFEYFNHKAIHNCSNTLEILNKTDISCPRFDTYLPVSVEFSRKLLKRQFEKRELEKTFDPFDGLQ